MRSKIIDLSQFNTVTDWDLVKANVDAIIIRVGFRYSRNGFLCIDNKYVEYRRQCKRLNIPYTLYWFTEAITEEEAVQEADLVAYECRDMSKYILPVFVDSEYIDGQGRADNLDKATRTKVLNAFCARLQALGVPAGIYCNYSWSINNLDRSKLPYSFWIAQWGKDKPDTDDYLIWQKTNRGSVPGIQGYVDISTEKIGNRAVTRLLARALAEDGYLEKRNGDARYLYDKTANVGSANYTKYGKEMHSIQPSNMDYPAAWCDAFVDWCFYKEFGVKLAKLMLCGNFDDYTVNSAAYYKAAGRWFMTPAVGDQIFFNDASGGVVHTGIVTEVTDHTVYTIEGNTSAAGGTIAKGGCVRRKQYALTFSRIAGYGRPRYELAE